jgi:hypothetical protein
MTQRLRVRAKVIFLSPEQGGRSTPPHSGVRTQLKVKDVFTSCIVLGDNKEEVFEYGVEYGVTIELLFGGQYIDQIFTGMPVQLNEGSRIVAFGKIEALS